MNKTVAILTEKGFEEVELTSPREALEKAGFTTKVVSPQKEKVKAKSGDDWSKDYDVDVHLSEAYPADFDALLLPGGVINPDLLRVNKDAIKFVQHFFENNKPVAAICHGPQTLINAEVVKGLKMTSVEAISADLKNAGANWEDAEVVEDKGLVTSRVPKDLPAFNKKIVEVFSK